MAYWLKDETVSITIKNLVERGFVNATLITNSKRTRHALMRMLQWEANTFSRKFLSA
jgi:hypothetical protein